MAPTIVRDAAGQLRLVVGSPGGSRIIGYVTQALVAVLDWGLDVQAAIGLGHVVNRNGPTDIEGGTGAEALAAPLRQAGPEVRLRKLVSGLHAIEVVEGGPGGAAAKRPSAG